MISSRLTGWLRGQLRQAQKRRRMFRFLHCGSDLPHHAERVGYSTQGARIQKGRVASSSQLVSKVQRLASKLPLSTVET